MPGEYLPELKGATQRQNVKAVDVRINLADWIARGNVLDLDIVPDSAFFYGEVVIEVADNSGTTAVIDIGDAVDPDRYVAAANLKAAANTRTAFTITGYRNTPGNSKLRLTRTPVGAAATAGTIVVRGVYTTVGAGDFTQG